MSVYKLTELDFESWVTLEIELLHNLELHFKVCSYDICDLNYKSLFQSLHLKRSQDVAVFFTYDCPPQFKGLWIPFG